MGKAYLGAAFTYGIGPGYILGGEGSRFKHVGIGWDVYVSSFTAETDAPLHPSYKYELLGFLGSAVYHFTPKQRFDPFAKAGIGYFIWNTKDVQDAKYTSGFVLNGQVGFRLFLSTKLAFKTSVGYPHYYVNVGFDYEFFDSGERGD